MYTVDAVLHETLALQCCLVVAMLFSFTDKAITCVIFNERL